MMEINSFLGIPARIDVSTLSGRKIETAQIDDVLVAQLFHVIRFDAISEPESLISISDILVAATLYFIENTFVGAVLTSEGP